MGLSVDNFVSILHLKKLVARWRFISLFLLLIIVLLVPYIGTDVSVFKAKQGGNNIIARIYISGFIDDDHARDRLIHKIKENNKVKGVIVHIDSPGGTFVGGEALYNSLRELSAKKHVVSVMGNIATSAAYMAAIATDHVIAHHGTITGSIGVLLQSFNLTDLASKIGVNVDFLKAGEFKDSLSPFVKMSDESRNLLNEMLEDEYNYFLSLVAKRRSMSLQEVKEKAEGKVYAGQQALKLSLVDQIGGEVEAINWLKSNNIDAKIEDFAVPESGFFLSKLFNIPQQSFALLTLLGGYTSHE